MFADSYIENNIVYPPFIKEESSSPPKVVIVIPCLNEPAILQTLQSLWDCQPVEVSCEVIVAVNESEDSPQEVKDFNEKTYADLLQWKMNDRERFILHPIYAREINARFAGAGMARKIVMDEAIRRFNAADQSDGVIISLDADCLVSKNYLTQIVHTFSSSKSCFAATINFRHRVEEIEDQRQQVGIRLYEDYLHYYKQALEYTGFPHSIYTIGSAFAVRADAYVKQGGMNRRQAGEDFYFLHKLTKLGRLTEIADAYVYPSARVSNRVPFGTGAAMTKWMNQTEDLTLTYCFEAFKDLKQLFEKVDLLYKIPSTQFDKLLLTLPSSIQEYLNTIQFEDKIAEITKNSTSTEAFRKRFYQVFDAFQVLKFLNRAHDKYYSEQDLREAIAQLTKASD